MPPRRHKIAAGAPTSASVEETPDEAAKVGETEPKARPVPAQELAVDETNPFSGNPGIDECWDVSLCEGKGSEERSRNPSGFGAPRGSRRESGPPRAFIDAAGLSQHRREEGVGADAIQGSFQMR
jgi:hypothetical protein